MTDAEKEAIKVTSRLTEEYSDFEYSVKKKLDSVKEKHQSSLSNIKSQISSLRDSLRSLNAEYQKQQGSDVASIAERIVQEEVSMADIRKRLANETSFEQIQALTNELRAKETALQSTQGFQAGIQGAIDEARRRASLTEIERAIEDFNQRRAEAEQEYQARTSEINREISQLKDQKKKETALYEEQRTKLREILNEQKQHYQESITGRYALTEEYLKKEMDLYKQLERQIDRVLSKQSASSSGSSNKGRATGGGVQTGQSYMVGEKGPEMFTPASNGSITPNYKMAGSVGINLTINMNGGTYLDDTVAEKIGDKIIQSFKRVARI
jgi:chromosome segregation ATPase